jgi:D-2-hydroxyglutarate dehydrogenase
VGATVSGKGELIVSLERLDRIVDVDKAAQTVTVEPGVVLETLQKELESYGLSTPYDLGARGSCTIGGNIATNAGGINFIRNGPLRGHVIGLQAVLANGEIVDSMSRMWKDNTGIDLKQLFIGSEGSLGVITRIRLRCTVLPVFKAVALVQSSRAFSESVVSALDLARTHIGESLSAFEFFDSEAFPEGIGGSRSGFTILVEASGSFPVQDRLERFIEAVSSQDTAGVVAFDSEGIRKLWSYREIIPVEMARLGPNLKYDVSLPLSDYYQLVHAVRKKFDSHDNVGRIAGYGHVGDGNLHLNIALKLKDPLLSDRISHFVYDFVNSVGGSTSAEHGIGRDKLPHIALYKPSSCVKLMRGLKRLLDPHGILNPGRTVPLVQ